MFYQVIDVEPSDLTGSKQQKQVKNIIQNDLISAQLY